jgi:hypothetical protein
MLHLRLSEHPILRGIRRWKFDPFPMLFRYKGQDLRVWNDPRTGETRYPIDGRDGGPLYSGIKKASDDE